MSRPPKKNPQETRISFPEAIVYWACPPASSTPGVRETSLPRGGKIFDFPPIQFYMEGQANYGNRSTVEFAIRINYSSIFENPFSVCFSVDVLRQLSRYALQTRCRSMPLLHLQASAGLDISTNPKPLYSMTLTFLTSPCFENSSSSCSLVTE